MRHKIICFLLITLPGTIHWAMCQQVNENSNNRTVQVNAADGIDQSNKDFNQDRSKQVATKPVSEQVYSRQTSEWYLDQSDAWRDNLQFNKSDAEAWFNYYKSARYAGTDQAVLDQIVYGMNTNVPNTFETHYVNYLHSNRSLDKGGELLKAHQLGPNRKEIYKELAVFYTLKGDKANLKTTFEQWSKIDDIPQSLMDYSYNLLNTVPQNSVLITDGEYDTYPMWILQSENKHRQDVKVLNIELMKNEDYKERICKEFGLICYGTAYVKSQFVQNLVVNNPTKEIYVSYTVNQNVIEPIQDKLFNEGLAYRYSSNSGYDNEKRLTTNWELVYKTDYLQGTISGNEQFPASKMRSLHLNYVASGLELYDIYVARGEKQKATALQELLLKLAKSAGKEDMVKKYLSK